jgi:hypothetical protein
LETLVNCILQAFKDKLTLWNVKVEGDLFDVHDRPAITNEMFMTCYFNMGTDAEIGASNYLEKLNILFRFRKNSNSISLL